MGQLAHTSLLGLQLPELTSLVEEFGQPVYRARQLFEALYRRRVETLDQVSTLPHNFRESLSEKGITVGLPAIDKKFVSVDGTVRYLVSCPDGQSVETVWMPEGDGGEAGDGSDAGDQIETAGRSWERATICVSS
ncbi:MAG: 23S rRNA (adenine(2503)-C(2))-methyltransferase RlmN, partial [Terriglobales bacterium]